jgi:hypothetical protein
MLYSVERVQVRTPTQCLFVEMSACAFKSFRVHCDEFLLLQRLYASPSCLVLVDTFLEMASMPFVEYPGLVAKGRTIYAQLVRAVEYHGDRFQPLPEIAPYYYTTFDPPSMPFLFPETENSIADAGHPRGSYVFIDVNNSGHWAQPLQSPYQNYVHAEGKALLCMNNFANRDQLFMQPERIFWSDLMAVCCAQVMATHGGNMRGLEAIWRVTIKNQVRETSSYMLC